MSAQKPLCEIKCLHCNQWLRSPIQFGDAENFFTSTLVGNQMQCPNCGGMTGCNKANMRFRAVDEGFLGKDTQLRLRLPPTLDAVRDRHVMRLHFLRDRLAQLREVAEGIKAELRQ